MLILLFFHFRQKNFWMKRTLELWTGQEIVLTSTQLKIFGLRWQKSWQQRLRTKNELQRLLINVWYKEISIEYVQKLVNSMPQRVQAVIKAKGGLH